MNSSRVPDPPSAVEAAAWPPECLGECLQRLLAHAGLLSARSRPEDSHAAPQLDSTQVAAYVSRKAEQLGCAAMLIESDRSALRVALTSNSPALLALDCGKYLAIVSKVRPSQARARRSHLRCLQMDGTICDLDPGDVCRAVETAADRDRRETLATLLSKGVRGGESAEVLDRLVEDTAPKAPFHGLWVFRAGSGSPPGRWIKDSGVVTKAVSLLIAHSAQYGLWLASWALLGRLTFSGHMDRAWLVAWALLLATIVPCRALATWLQGVIPILLGGELKRRILEGALKLEPDEIRKDGIGAFLGQALEAEALESLALGGGIVGLLAILDLAVCSLVLGKLTILMLIWLCLAIAAAGWFLKSFESWSGTRLSLTHDLVEAMVGHRTRLAQLDPEHWHDSEDEALCGYHSSSSRVDRIGALLVAGVPRGWLVAAIAFVSPQVVSAQTSTSQLATSIGGILLAFTAFERLMNSLSEIAAAGVAWRRAGFLFRAAARPDANGLLGAVLKADNAAPILEADRLEFRYRDRGPAVLESCNLSVRRGDRILLEGASGSGKTTLAGLLSGTLEPQAGLLLSAGLDIHSLGRSGWRDRIVCAPQFHDNHILTGTFAFNVLMGKGWPPAAADFEEAETVCRSLGLGQLLDRMPSGLLQMVGDGGWQLSHGERSRVFIARALLQHPGLIVLDESFGSLDPQTLHKAVSFTRERAQSLIVIAHP